MRARRGHTDSVFEGFLTVTLGPVHVNLEEGMLTSQGPFQVELETESMKHEGCNGP